MDGDEYPPEVGRGFAQADGEGRVRGRARQYQGARPNDDRGGPAHDAAHGIVAGAEEQEGAKQRHGQTRRAASQASSAVRPEPPRSAFRPTGPPRDGWESEGRG